MQQLFIFGKVKYLFIILFFDHHLLVHNHVNKRLHGDETEDPKYPKVPFPPEYLCSKCQSNNDDFDLSNIVDFLLKYYSKDNIDLSSVENFNISNDNKEEMKPRYERKSLIEQNSMIEINNESTQTSFLISVFQRFSLYIFVIVVIIIFFVRRRYCKGKRKRYTL
jgi:hypothetical protein